MTAEILTFNQRTGFDTMVQEAQRQRTAVVRIVGRLFRLVRRFVEAVGWIVVFGTGLAFVLPPS